MGLPARFRPSYVADSAGWTFGSGLQLCQQRRPFLQLRRIVPKSGAF